MATFNSCCCCTLRVGTTLLGAFQTILSGAGLTASSLMLFVYGVEKSINETRHFILNLHHNIKYASDNSTVIPVTDWLDLRQTLVAELIVLSAALFFLFCTLVNVLLIIGAVKELPVLLMPWLVMQWVSIFATSALLAIVLWLLISELGRYWWVIVVAVAIILLMFISFLLVLSLRQTIKDREYPVPYEKAELVHRHLWTSNQIDYSDDY